MVVAIANAIITELCQMSNGVKIVHGKPRHSQSQRSVERANQDIQNMITTWMEKNSSKKWSESLRFVQAMKNNAYHEGIKRSPYEAMFGCPMRMGFSSANNPSKVLPNIKSEENLEKALCQDDSNDLINEENIMTSNFGEENDGVSCDMENGVVPSCSSGTSATIVSTFEDNNYEIELIDSNASNIQQHRQQAHKGLEEQAKKMKMVSNKKFPPATLGQTVKVKIPEVDRSKTDPRTLLAVIMDIKDDDFYQLGTSAGTLPQLFTRNQFTICKENFINSVDVSVNEISVRGAVRQMSLSGGQGFQRCNCTRKCSTNRCLCKSSGKLCNSKCHGSSSCTNK